MATTPNKPTAATTHTTTPSKPAAAAPNKPGAPAPKPTTSKPQPPKGK